MSLCIASKADKMLKVAALERVSFFQVQPEMFVRGHVPPFFQREAECFFTARLWRLSLACLCPTEYILSLSAPQ